MDEPLTLPIDTQIRMVLISERHLANEYAYMRSIVASHEKELAWLTVGVAGLLLLDYYLMMRLYKMEKRPNE